MELYWWGEIPKAPSLLTGTSYSFWPKFHALYITLCCWYFFDFDDNVEKMVMKRRNLQGRHLSSALLVLEILFDQNLGWWYWYPWYGYLGDNVEKMVLKRRNPQGSICPVPTAKSANFLRGNHDHVGNAQKPQKGRKILRIKELLEFKFCYPTIHVFKIWGKPDLYYWISK